MASPKIPAVTEDSLGNEKLSSKVEDHQIESVQDEIQRQNINKLSETAITWRSRAALRLIVVIIIQGLSTETVSCP